MSYLFTVGFRTTGLQTSQYKEMDRSYWSGHFIVVSANSLPTGGLSQTYRSRRYSSGPFQMGFKLFWEQRGWWIYATSVPSTSR